MSDPAYPYGANPASAQDPYSQQTPYGPAASAPYGQPEAAYRQQPAYGMPNGMAYSQPTPAYAQPYYASSHLVAYADLRSQAHLAMILAGVSFLTVYLLLSIPAMVLSFMQRRKAKRLDAPQDIMSLTNTASCSCLLPFSSPFSSVIDKSCVDTTPPPVRVARQR